jgi:hypothetical protein
MAEDQFAAIAERGRERDDDVLERIPPRDVDRDPLESYEGTVPLAGSPPYEERLETFDEDLAAVRKQYEPFLRELHPSPTIERTTTPLSEFEFRYTTDDDGDTDPVVPDDAEEWKSVTVPDYRGPEGAWTGVYRTTFEYGELKSDRAYLRFRGVDYASRVSLNGDFLGTHEGFFAPFEFDVTNSLEEGENTLVVEIENDVGMNGGTNVEFGYRGDKIYAATGIGWDDPEGGWQHCPPGAGIYQPVTIEERPAVHLEDCFVRPLLDDDAIEAWVEVQNATNDLQAIELDLTIHPQNFDGDAIDGGVRSPNDTAPSRNDYRLGVDLSQYRTWTPEEPWLYALQVDLLVDGSVVDSIETQFGMRSYTFDETMEPRGEPHLNGEPIRLRGANTMGHMQRCVMAGDDEQLRDDVLIGKLANQNYFRLTQRPVQEEIYEVCDKLGMMLQTDFPLFGQLRRNQTTEAIRQAEEMERLVRGHPSAIHSTFINEASDPLIDNEEHRVCSRPELEDFMDAATNAMRLNNPDRAIKRVEGDYNPPTRRGISDFHTYSLWYTNHGLPIGELHAGWLPEIDPEWLTACGEYGAEGLDNLAVMQQHYPEDWLPDDLKDDWTPESIYKSQTFGMHGDWYDEQETIEKWIEVSQRHQARSTTLLTDAFRRRSDWVMMSAIHLLIDAWPAGWMKAIVDTHRTPKRAFFAYQDANEPVRVHLRTDRHDYYGGESINVEAWLLNDLNDRLLGHRIEAGLRVDGEQVGAVARDDVSLEPVSGEYNGHIDLLLPSVDTRTDAAVDAVLYDADGRIVNTEQLPLTVSPSPTAWSQTVAVAAMGSKAERALDALDIDSVPLGSDPDAIVVDGESDIDAAIEEEIADGATALLLRQGGGTWTIGDRDIETVEHHGLTFVAPSETHETDNIAAEDLSFLYDSNRDRIGFVADSYVATDLEPVVHTFPMKQTVGETEEYAGTRKTRAPVVGQCDYGDGQCYVSELFTDGMLGHNPGLDRLMRVLLGMDV